ncbi:Kinase non-catalytic C-lobe domain-containing protein [Trichinella spiralis]|uniref:Kinase non-catalytic C-lobe domain-containing protein n=1 Tax=Trichinella spiralis TaxID=6334 RepID=A0ABR3KSX4_TRISP
MDSVLKREIDTASVSMKCEEEIEEKAQCQCCRSRSFSEARLESLSTGGRRQTIKANRPNLQEEAHNKAASHTVDLAIIRMIFALCQQSITSCRLVEVRGSIQVCSTSRLWAVWMKAFSFYRQS